MRAGCDAPQAIGIHTMLTVLDHLPEAFLTVDARTLHTVLSGPSLIHLDGRRDPPVFVSLLLHGNEDTGLAAVQALLRKYLDRPLPRAVSVFVGNVGAAREGVRRLDGQPDFNRIWPGCRDQDTPEHRMMREVVARMAERGVFASIDIHNNTGLNPHYACVNRLDHRFFQLATLFSRTVVYFIRPRGVQSMAFAELCPAVTVECGKTGNSHGVEHVLQYLDAALHLAAIPNHPVAEHDMELYHTVATVTVPDEVDFGFGPDGDHSLRLSPYLDHLNFRELPVGSALGSVRAGVGLGIQVLGEQGEDVADRFFTLEDGEIRTARPVMPSMFTLNKHVIRQDCLGYLMERMDHIDAADRDVGC
jgi:hypothetical protein